MPHTCSAFLQSEMTPVQVALLRMNIYACVDVLSEMLSMSVCQNVAVFSGMAFIHAPYNFLSCCFWSWEKLGSAKYVRELMIWVVRHLLWYPGWMCNRVTKPDFELQCNKREMFHFPKWCLKYKFCLHINYMEICCR